MCSPAILPLPVTRNVGPLKFCERLQFYPQPVTMQDSGLVVSVCVVHLSQSTFRLRFWRYEGIGRSQHQHTLSVVPFIVKFRSFTSHIFAVMDCGYCPLSLGHSGLPGYLVLVRPVVKYQAPILGCTLLPLSLACIMKSVGNEKLCGRHVSVE